MAKVLIEGDSVDIRVGFLERVMLAERPRRLPLAQIRSVDPHPPLLEMMVHWSDQGGVWLCGVSSYDGQMIPSSRHPSNILAIEVEGEKRERIYVEIDGESPVQTAELIARALRANNPSVEAGGSAHEQNVEARGSAREQEIEEEPMATSSNPTGTPEAHGAPMQALEIEIEDEDDDDDVQLRDPLLQGSLPPPPMTLSEPAPELKLDDDRDLSRLGAWLVALGSLGLLTGGIMLASGALPGLLAVGAGVACALLGGVALAVVAHHQG